MYIENLERVLDEAFSGHGYVRALVEAAEDSDSPYPFEESRQATPATPLPQRGEDSALNR